MLERNIEKRPNSFTCIRDNWFSTLYSSSVSRKGENGLADKTLQLNRESASTKCRLQAALSLNVDLEESDEWSESLK